MQIFPSTPTSQGKERSRFCKNSVFISMISLLIFDYLLFHQNTKKVGAVNCPPFSNFGQFTFWKSINCHLDSNYIWFQDQLLINGRNHLALKNALAQQMQQQIIPGQVPTMVSKLWIFRALHISSLTILRLEFKLLTIFPLLNCCSQDIFIFSCTTSTRVSASFGQ